jgi:hypothetical protein
MDVASIGNMNFADYWSWILTPFGPVLFFLPLPVMPRISSETPPPCGKPPACNRFGKSHQFM